MYYTKRRRKETSVCNHMRLGHYAWYETENAISLGIHSHALHLMKQSGRRPSVLARAGPAQRKRVGAARPGR